MFVMANLVNKILFSSKFKAFFNYLEIGMVLINIMIFLSTITPPPPWISLFPLDLVVSYCSQEKRILRRKKIESTLTSKVSIILDNFM